MTLDLEAIKARAEAIPAVGYLATELNPQWRGPNGERISTTISILATKDTPALIAEVEQLRQALEAQQSGGYEELRKRHEAQRERVEAELKKSRKGVRP